MRTSSKLLKISKKRTSSRCSETKMKPTVLLLHSSTLPKLNHFSMNHPTTKLFQCHSEEVNTIENIITNTTKSTQRIWWNMDSNGTCIRWLKKSAFNKLESAPPLWLASVDSSWSWVSCFGKDSSSVLLTRSRNHNLPSRITSWDQKLDQLFHKPRTTKELFNTLQFNQIRFNHNMFKLLNKLQLQLVTLQELTLLSENLSKS